jgi:hypothetical protein
MRRHIPEDRKLNIRLWEPQFSYNHSHNYHVVLWNFKLGCVIKYIKNLIFVYVTECSLYGLVFLVCFPYFEKEWSRLMKSPCCLCVCEPPQPTNLWMLEPVFMKLGMYIITYEGLEWLVIISSGLNDWIYWNFFYNYRIITVHIQNSCWINHDSSLTNTVRVESYVATDGQSASLSWNKAPIWGLRPNFYYCQTVAGLLLWVALSDERMSLSFTIAAGHHQRSHSRVRVPWNSRPYFTVSD